MNEVLDVLGALRGIEIVLRVLKGSTKWAARTFLDSFERPGERQELISQLFLDQGDFLFHPSTDWRPAKGQGRPPSSARGYPHDLRALRAFSPFLPEDASYQETLFFPAKLDPASRLVAAGSPKANALVRRYLPSIALTEHGAEQQYPTFIRPASLRYLFGEDLTARTVKVVSMMNEGAVADKTRKTLWSWKGKDDLKPWQPRGYRSGSALERDFLLVSRLPRTPVGGDLLAFAGAHGAGTEAVALLLRRLHIRELRELARRLHGAPYYQFVIEVTRVKHTRRGTIPERILISEDLPPTVLTLSAGDLSAKPGRAGPWR